MPRAIAVLPHAQAAGRPGSEHSQSGTAPSVVGAGNRPATWQLFDKLLTELGPAGSLEHFFLDGHLAALEDYSNVHPGAEQTLRDLARAGRLGLGAWQVLIDEFAASGETIIHNLQAGRRWATHLGDQARVALLPPAWGHIAQLPQLLRQSGTQYAVIMAGPWPGLQPNAFWWRAPDGSSVRAEYLESFRQSRLPPEAAPSRQDPTLPAPVAGGATSVPRDETRGAREEARGKVPARPEGRLAEWIAAQEQGRTRPTAGASGEGVNWPAEAWLWPHHTDISGAPGGELGAQVRSPGDAVQPANSRQDRYLFRVTAAASYFDSAPTEGLASVRGELRPAALAPGLAAPGLAAPGWDGVFSGRLDLAAAAAAAERALERLAEPLCALWLSAEEWPSDELNLAWDTMVRNAGWRLAATSQGLATAAPPSLGAVDAMELGPAYA
ncbi:MAG TPA: hypothetical protein VME46_18330, partial [Acidimicrobiales bacterium]|nr:hypothetical protein [Acidimicrobiales bacterium]